MTLKSDAKFEEKLTCGLGLSCPFIQKLTCPFIQSKKCISLKFTKELYVMTMKNDAKFKEELTCCFKIEMKNLTNFDPSTPKSQKLAL